VKRIVLGIILLAACGGTQAPPPTPSNVAPAQERTSAPRGRPTSGPDTDGDGIVNDDDKCESVPEDFDSFEDVDGCPDADNDRDGILDIDDMCPSNAEVANGTADDDGCPD
jgi:hypothetical protein